MRDTLIALRVLTAQWMQPANLDRLLAFLRRWPGTIDELIFFTSATHAPLPLDEVAQRSQRLAAVLSQAKGDHYRVGLNVLATIGHHNENLPYSLNNEWPRLTDPVGNVCMGAYCPGDERVLEYVTQLYTLTAQAGPEFIWVDDDIRLMGHMPIRATCFCDGCVRRFNQETGVSFQRETLVAALQSSSGDLKRQWLEHNRQLITHLLQVITTSVHQVDPAIQLGFMSGDRFYEGYAFAEWAEALSSKEPGKESGNEAGNDAALESNRVRWRPGGGFYNDDAYLGLVEKAHDVGRQVSQLPASVTIIQSEIENFPYQPLRKSVAITGLEAAAHMAAGATGLAFNVLSQQPDPLDEYSPLFEAITRARPFYTALRQATGRGRAMGIWPAWNRDTFAAATANGDWIEGNTNLADLRRTYALGELGLPMAYEPQGASVTLLTASSLTIFSRAELERIFAGGVLMDGAALVALTDLGMAEWAGAKVVGIIKVDTSEVLCDHPLNGSFVGWSRDCRQSFWPQPAYQLQATHPNTTVLAHLSDYAENNLGPTMSAFENSLGGRVVVAGYYPWSLLHSLAKSTQIKSICRWLSGDTLPVIVKNYAKVVVWAREWTRARESGIPAIVLLNASLDPLPELTLQLFAPAQKFVATDMTGRTFPLESMTTGNYQSELMLRDLAPWALLLIQPLTAELSA